MTVRSEKTMFRQNSCFMFVPNSENSYLNRFFSLTTYVTIVDTGGPPLTRKSLTRFPLPRFLAYVRVSGGISVSRGPQYSPTNTNFM